MSVEPISPGVPIMIALVACLLCQLEPAKTEPISLDAFVARSVAQQARVFDDHISTIQEQIRANKGNGAVLAKLKKQVAIVKAAKAKAPFPPLAASLDLSKMEMGDAGGFVYYGFGAVPTVRGVRSLQVVNGIVLCECEKSTFAVTGVDTTNIVDNKAFDLRGIWQVSGTFTYTTVLGASRKVPVLTPWKHRDVFEKLTAADKPVPLKTAK